MKKISILLTSLIMAMVMAMNAFAQDKADAGKEVPKKVDPTYMMLGLQAPFLYYLSDQKSTLNYGLVFKAPAYKDFGVELAINSIVVPIKEYSIGAFDYSGSGEENYVNYRIDVLYFFQFSRYFQAKLGFDYYQFAGGYINHNLGVVDPAFGVDCGTTYVECKKCVGDQYGINIGVNLDVPLYKDFYVLSSLGYRYVLSDHKALNAGMIDFTLGLGYKL